jgi:hypothetical protein
VTNGVLTGDVTLKEGSAAARVLVAHQKMIETADLWPRVMALDKMVKARCALDGEQAK